MREKVSENKVSLDHVSVVTLVSDFTANSVVKPLVHELQVIAGQQSHFYLFTLLPSMCASFLPSNSSRTAGT